MVVVVVVVVTAVHLGLPLGQQQAQGTKTRGLEVGRKLLLKLQRPQETGILIGPSALYIKSRKRGKGGGGGVGVRVNCSRKWFVRVIG